MNSLEAKHVRAYLERGWGELDRVTTVRRGAESIALAESLYAHARAHSKGWPSEADRQADLQAHIRLVRIFSRTRGAKFDNRRID